MEGTQFTAAKTLGPIGYNRDRYRILFASCAMLRNELHFGLAAPLVRPFSRPPTPASVKALVRRHPPAYTLCAWVRGKPQVKNYLVTLAALFVLASANSSAAALPRYECKGLSPDTIVLAPYTDGTVTLSFNNGGPEYNSTFSHHGDVLAAEFANVDGVANTLLVIILDTITKNGYEYFRLPGRPSGASKITCFWFPN